MKKYELLLKNEKIKLYSRISWIVISIQAILFLYLILYPSSEKSRTWAISILSLLAICLFLHYYLRNTKWKPGFHPFFIFLICGWIFLDEFWLAGVTLVFDILSSFALQKPVVRISSDMINYPSFPPKQISWDKLSNVLLKDGLITIDFKNNKIIQQFIEESNVVNEDEFNDFCSKQLSQSHSPLPTNH